MSDVIHTEKVSLWSISRKNSVCNVCQELREMELNSSSTKGFKGSGYLKVIHIKGSTHV